MSRWNLLIAVLFLATACNKNNPPAPEPKNEQPPVVVVEPARDEEPMISFGGPGDEKEFAAQTAILSQLTNPLTFSGNIVTPSNRTITVSGTQKNLHDGKKVIVDPSVVASGATTFTLSGANTYTGGAVVTSGLNGRSGVTKERVLRERDGKFIVGAPEPSAKPQDAEQAAKFLNELQLRAQGQPRLGDQSANGDPRDSDTENYERIFDNPYKLVKHDPLSTISSAVDTASYSNVRARMNAGALPPKDAVRIADMLNYFSYDYAGPKDDQPVAFSLEIAPCSWQPKHHLLRIGLKAKTIDKDKMPPRNLTFLIDTPGSMNRPNRLPLVKESLKLLVGQLTEKDMVSIVTYAGNAGVALQPTPGSEKDTILKMIDSFNA